MMRTDRRTLSPLALSLLSCGLSLGCGGELVTEEAGLLTGAWHALQEATLTEDCSRYPYSAATLLAERAGFGAAVTGGSPSRVYRVTSLADSGPGTLRAGLASTASQYIVFDVEGTIKLSSRMDVLSDKTVDGRGRNIVIDGTLRLPAGTRNVILSDVTIQNPAGFAKSEGDSIEVRGRGGSSPADFESRDLWFHHLGLGRGGDGQLDLRAATQVTISYSHLYGHAKSMLHWKDTDGNPAPGMRVTLHHNHFEKITRRSPQFSFGLADFYNNYLEHWYEFGAASNDGAQLLSEANIYEARPGTFCLPGCPDPNSPTHDSDFWVSKKALVSGWDNAKGYSRSVHDYLINDAKVEQHEPSRVFARSTYYRARVDKADDTLRRALKDDAGPRVRYCH
ncbi:MAG TPA: hypothetical protein PKI03_33400 [Pseudomonadota bacterium]|nr:hypothetical protein [Pseudomonadota bacterium]